MFKQHEKLKQLDTPCGNVEVYGPSARQSTFKVENKRSQYYKNQKPVDSNLSGCWTQVSNRQRRRDTRVPDDTVAKRV